MVKRGLQKWKRETDFLLRFAAVFAPLYAFLILVDLPPLNSAIAFLEGNMLRGAGLPVSINGPVVSLAGSAALMANECSGLVMVSLLAALLLSTDVPRRLKAFAVFAPLLMAFNISRLFLTLFVYFSYPAFFDAVHALLWFVDSAVVLACWYAAYSGRV